MNPDRNSEAGVIAPAMAINLLTSTTGVVGFQVFPRLAAALLP